MFLLAAILVGCAATVTLAFVFAPRRNMETQIGIEATPEKVWAVLSDTKTYHEWNPFIRTIEGDLVQGERLKNTMTPLNGGTMVFRPVVLVAESNRELRWLGRLSLPRLFDGEHYFLLKIQDGGTRLVHGENFCGILLWGIGIERFRKSFETMNAALKARVEAAGDR